MSDARFSTQISQPSQSRYLPLALLAIVALSIAVRLPGIGRPLVGSFATKNVVYAMIARNWAEGRAPLWYPTLDQLAGGRRSLHMLEFPVSAYLTGSLWRTFGGRLDVWGRATAVAFSAASVALLFLLVGRWHGRRAALGAAAVLALSPVSIIYGQSFMLEASLVFFTLATFYTLDRWLSGGRSAWLAVALVALALLLLTKIYMLVLLLPLGVMVLRAGRYPPRPLGEDQIAPLSPLGEGQIAPPLPLGEGRGEGLMPPSIPPEEGSQAVAGPCLDLPAGPPRRKWSRIAISAAVLGLAVVPAAAWYWHAARTAAPDSPLARHVFYSVRESAAVHRPPHPVLRSPDFYRQVLDDLAGVVLTPVGLVLLLAGLLDRAWRREAAWLLAMLILVAALPLKFYEMSYYWMAVLPPLCILAGLGWGVVQRRLRPGRGATACLLIVVLVLSLRYAAGPAFVTPQEDRAVVAAAAAVRELTEEEEPVVTVHGSTIDLLYYCNRPGWAVAPQTPDLESVLADCRRQGARYAVVAGPEDAAGVTAAPAALERRPVVARGDGFRVFELAR